jgi:hypothetical protein
MNDVVPVEARERSVSPFDGNVAEFKGALVRRGDNRKALLDWIREALVDGTDFGAIKRSNGSYTKPSLRKPGAEKICGMLGIVATFPTLKDYEQAVLQGIPIGAIILRCHLLSAAGAVVADGVGARSVDEDGGDLNKALKMACKSAHIDATLRMAGLSELFTQDLEDRPSAGALDAIEHASAVQGQFHENGHNPQRGGYTPGKNTGVPPTQKPEMGRGFATAKQISLLKYRCEEAGISYEEFLNVNGLPNWDSIPFTSVNPLLQWIGNASPGSKG